MSEGPSFLSRQREVRLEQLRATCVQSSNVASPDLPCTSSLVRRGGRAGRQTGFVDAPLAVNSSRMRLISLYTWIRCRGVRDKSLEGQLDSHQPQEMQRSMSGLTGWS